MQVVRDLFFASGDVSSAEGRGRERARRMALTTVTSAAAQAVRLAVPVVTIPATLHYLGEERFGLWMTVTSIVLMLGFADLGLGNSLITAIAKADDRDDRAEASTLVSSAVGMLCGVAACTLLLALAFVPSMDWGRLFNVSSPGVAADARLVILAGVGCFAAGLPLGIVQKVQAAYQEGFQSNLWQCASSVLSMAGLLFAVWRRLSLPLLVLIVMGVPVLVLAANAGSYAWLSRPWLRPRLNRFDFSVARRLLWSGGAYVLISLLMTIGYQCDNLILARVLGLSAVTQYSIPAKLASFLNLVPMVIYQPLWSANAEALARGDVGWVRRQTSRIQKLSVGLTVLGAALFVAAGPPAIEWWLGRRIAVSGLLTCGLAMCAIAAAVAGPWFMLLNATGDLWVQVRLYTVFTTCSVVLKAIAAMRFGMAAVPWVTAICYAVLVLPPLRIATLRWLASRAPER